MCVCLGIEDAIFLLTNIIYHHIDWWYVHCWKQYQVYSRSVKVIWYVLSQSIAHAKCGKIRGWFWPSLPFVVTLNTYRTFWRRIHWSQQCVATILLNNCAKQIYLSLVKLFRWTRTKQNCNASYLEKLAFDFVFVRFYICASYTVSCESEDKQTQTQR